MHGPLQVTCAALVPVLCGCTFVSIESNSNTISDTGGHGGLTVTTPDHDDLEGRLRRQQGE
jgi:hypothetical protein